jgi:hypothetical protein
LCVFPKWHVVNLRFGAPGYPDVMTLDHTGSLQGWARGYTSNKEYREMAMNVDGSLLIVTVPPHVKTCHCG